MFILLTIIDNLINKLYLVLILVWYSSWGIYIDNIDNVRVGIQWQYSEHSFLNIFP